MSEWKLLDLLNFQDKFTYSLLTGEAKRTTNLADVDEYDLINHFGGYEETGTLRGAFPVDDKRTVSVPVTEFQIGLVIQRGRFMAKVAYFSST